MNMKLEPMVHFDDELERMYERYQRPGGNREEAMAKTVLGDPIYAKRVKMPKWSMLVTMLQEPKVALKYAHAWGIPTSKDAHRQRSEYFQRLAAELQRTYYDLVKYACDTYGDHGPLISGIVHDHFPASIKNRLRFLVTARQDADDASRLHDFLAHTRSPLFK